MKRIVKVLRHDDIADIVINEKGDCFDLIACEDCKVTSGKPHLISLGVSMKLPSGCVARLYDRSSTPKRYKVHLGNSVGYIDNSYCGNEDVWKYQAVSLKAGKGYGEIHKGDRICQFEIVLSQRATVWQKIKWLFTSGYKFQYVDSLKGNNRGGIGEGTGK